MTGDEENDPSFAELLGDARRLEPDKRRVSPTTPRKPRAGPSQDHSNPPARFRYPDPEQPRRAAAEGVNDAQLLALGRGEPEPEERIDLHGLRQDAARRLLPTRLQAARSRGLRCVVVIHGRGQHSETGEAVLRDALPGWLTGAASAPHVAAFAPAPARWGGDGATLVLLKRRD